MDRMWTLFGNTCNLDHTLKKRSRSSITEICLGGRFRSFFLYRYVCVCVFSLALLYRVESRDWERVFGSDIYYI